MFNTMLGAVNITVKKIMSLIFKTITDVCKCYKRIKMRLEESEMLEGGNLKEGFSEEGIFELAMVELEEVDARFREEQVLRAKQQRAFCKRNCNICNSVTGINYASMVFIIVNFVTYF